MNEPKINADIQTIFPYLHALNDEQLKKIIENYDKCIEYINSRLGKTKVQK